MPRQFFFIFFENNVLLTRGEDDHNHEWEIPGGHIDQGESCKEALFREMKEETGVVPERIQFVGLARIRVPLDLIDYPYPKPESYMMFYVGIVTEMYEPNELGKWVAIEEARDNSWVNEHRALFEAMCLKSQYLSGRHTATR